VSVVGANTHILDDSILYRVKTNYATSVLLNPPLEFGDMVKLKASKKLAGRLGPFFFAGVRIREGDSGRATTPTIIITKDAVFEVEFSSIMPELGFEKPTRDVLTTVHLAFASWAL
jgi:hypothetical protein